MSNWAEREEYERFYDWADRLGIIACDRCGALVRNEDLHDEFHHRIDMERKP